MNRSDKIGNSNVMGLIPRLSFVYETQISYNFCLQLLHFKGEKV